MRGARLLAEESVVVVVLLTVGRGRILCATGYSLISEPGQPINDVPEIAPEKTNVSFIPTDGTAELKLLVNGEPEKVDEVRYNAVPDCGQRLMTICRRELPRFSSSKTSRSW